MKRIMILLAGALALAGCNTVAISSPGSLDGVKVKGAGGQASRVITIGTDGYYLLWSVPLFAGNMTLWDSTRHRLRDSVRFFSEETSPQKLQDILYRYAEELDCDVVDVVLNDRDSVDFMLFQGQSTSISAVLVPRKK